MDNEREDFWEYDEEKEKAFFDAFTEAWAEYVKERDARRVSGGLKPDFDRAGWTW